VLVERVDREHDARLPSASSSSRTLCVEDAVTRVTDFRVDAKRKTPDRVESLNHVRERGIARAAEPDQTWSPVKPILRWQIERDDRMATVRLVGELDIATADSFSNQCDELLAERVEHLVLDLRELTFMDSSGLRAIVRLHQAADRSTRVQIVDGPDHVQRLFTITGLRGVLSFTSATD
jgi:anti-anti-sigma factor